MKSSHVRRLVVSASVLAALVVPALGLTGGAPAFAEDETTTVVVGAESLRYTVGAGVPLAGATSDVISPDGATLYVLSTGTTPSVTALDTATMSVIGTIAIDGATSMAVSPDGATLYVGTATGVAPVDTARFGDAAYVPAVDTSFLSDLTSPAVAAVAVAPSGRLYVAVNSDDGAFYGSIAPDRLQDGTLTPLSVDGSGLDSIAVAAGGTVAVGGMQGGNEFAPNGRARYTYLGTRQLTAAAGSKTYYSYSYRGTKAYGDDAMACSAGPDPLQAFSASADGSVLLGGVGQLIVIAPAAMDDPGSYDVCGGYLQQDDGGPAWDITGIAAASADALYAVDSANGQVIPVTATEEAPAVVAHARVTAAAASTVAAGRRLTVRVAHATPRVRVRIRWELAARPSGTPKPIKGATKATFTVPARKGALLHVLVTVTRPGYAPYQSGYYWTIAR